MTAIAGGRHGGTSRARRTTRERAVGRGSGANSARTGGGSEGEAGRARRTGDGRGWSSPQGWTSELCQGLRKSPRALSRPSIRVRRAARIVARRSRVVKSSERPNAAAHCARRRSLAMAAAGDPEIARRRAEADALAAECERPRARRATCSPRARAASSPRRRFRLVPGRRRQRRSSTVADDLEAECPMASHAMSTMSHTARDEAVTRQVPGREEPGRGVQAEPAEEKVEPASGSPPNVRPRALSRANGARHGQRRARAIEKQHALERVANEKNLDACARASRRRTRASRRRPRRVRIRTRRRRRRARRARPAPRRTPRCRRRRRSFHRCPRRSGRDTSRA